MNFSLRDEALEKTMIAAHRGLTCGNIPGNTKIAFDAALHMGADMIELDVSKSGDDELFIFHPGMERVFLGQERRLFEMASQEIRELRFRNADHTLTDYPLMTLDEALEHLKGKCYINIDKFWDNPELICKVLRRHRMLDQVLIKSTYSESVVRVLEELVPDISFMLVVRDRDDYSSLLSKRNIQYVGAEVLFDSENAPVAADAYLEAMQKDRLIVWINAIVYNYRDVLAAGHNDDISIAGDPDKGWGWLLKKGFNIIQTDFPLALRQYINRQHTREL